VLKYAHDSRRFRPSQEGAGVWSEEVKRRIEDIDSGKVQMIPYEEVRRRLAALLSDAGK
jgi:hypothetical protein